MRVPALTLILSLASGCTEGSPASPSFESTEGALDASVVMDATAATDATADAAEEPSYVVCPADIDASFGSLYTQVLSTASCGTNNPSNCHSTSGSGSEGAGNLLDFSLDASSVYAELLSADGGLHRSTDLDYPSEDVARVVPGDAGASMLYIKLTITGGVQYPYGGGMPQLTPGSVCPATLAAVRDWINGGAKKK